jgi:hypothetical protein
VTGCGLDGPGSISGRGKIFSFHQCLNLCPTQWVLGALTTGVQRQVCEADHSHPSNAEVKNGGAVPPLPNINA